VPSKSYAFCSLLASLTILNASTIWTVWTILNASTIWTIWTPPFLRRLVQWIWCVCSPQYHLICKMISLCCCAPFPFPAGSRLGGTDTAEAGAGSSAEGRGSCTGWEGMWSDYTGLLRHLYSICTQLFKYEIQLALLLKKHNVFLPNSSRTLYKTQPIHPKISMRCRRVFFYFFGWHVSFWGGNPEGPPTPKNPLPVPPLDKKGYQSAPFSNRHTHHDLKLKRCRVMGGKLRYGRPCTRDLPGTHNWLAQSYIASISSEFHWLSQAGTIL